jgi:hypothetical protein
MMKRIFILYIFLFFIAACGGGSGDSNNNSDYSDLNTGVFTDSPVSGLGYTCGDVQGMTDEDGTYRCKIGDSIRFYIGNINLGSTIFSSIISPLDLVENGGTRTPEVQNIARFLQMLDSDMNTDNGITISTGVSALAENWDDIDFKQPLDITGIISDATSVDNIAHELPSAITASMHLEETLGIGSDIYSGCSRILNGTRFCDLADFPTCDTVSIDISEISDGMTYSEVANIFGCHGVLNTSDTTDEIGIYAWGHHDGYDWIVAVQTINSIPTVISYTKY